MEALATIKPATQRPGESIVDTNVRKIYRSILSVTRELQFTHPFTEALREPECINRLNMKLQSSLKSMNKDTLAKVLNDNSIPPPLVHNPANAPPSKPDQTTRALRATQTQTKAEIVELLISWVSVNSI